MDCMISNEKAIKKSFDCQNILFWREFWVTRIKFDDVGGVSTESSLMVVSVHVERLSSENFTKK